MSTAADGWLICIGCGAVFEDSEFLETTGEHEFYDADRDVSWSCGPVRRRYECRYCGRGSWLHPRDQVAPADVCHDADHGVAPL